MTHHDDRQGILPGIIEDYSFEMLVALKMIGACLSAQSNLLSTASDQDRRDFISKIYKCWNDIAVPILLEIDGEP